MKYENQYKKTIFPADPNILNHFGKFPLHIAVENNLLTIVKLLVDHGLDVDARDQAAGRTAVHRAVEQQLEDMVLLLVKEAKVDLRKKTTMVSQPLSLQKGTSQQISRNF